MSQRIAEVANSLYAESPTSMLYHYTSLDALAQIVPSKTMWATEIHYLNDSSELNHASQRLLAEVRLLEGDPKQDQEQLRQLAVWLRGRLPQGYLLFIVCFTEAGDLLSQWRGYTPHARGVSLGFSSAHLLNRAQTQQFLFGRCIYNEVEQAKLSSKAIRAVLADSLDEGPSSHAHPTQSYYPSFERAEGHLLRICALFKHDAFAAESEWRAVSPVVSDYVNTKIFYRPGKTTLVPYQCFNLAADAEQFLGLEHAVLGPTPHVNLGTQALAQFLSQYQVSVGPRSVTPSRVPYRET